MTNKLTSHHAEQEAAARAAEAHAEALRQSQHVRLRPTFAHVLCEHNAVYAFAAH